MAPQKANSLSSPPATIGLSTSTADLTIIIAQRFRLGKAEGAANQGAIPPPPRIHCPLWYRLEVAVPPRPGLRPAMCPPSTGSSHSLSGDQPLRSSLNCTIITMTLLDRAVPVAVQADEEGCRWRSVRACTWHAAGSSPPKEVLPSTIQRHPRALEADHPCVIFLPGRMTLCTMASGHIPMEPAEPPGLGPRSGGLHSARRVYPLLIPFLHSTSLALSTHHWHN
jgi:hypothetical protein